MALGRLGYRPALDGIRAVAILLVLALHGGFLTGGFLGVDLFFILSGFLITALLFQEWVERGSISLRRFDVRRARRLFPVLFLTILGVASQYPRIAEPAGSLSGATRGSPAPSSPAPTQ